jgi:hypothetical protein
MVVVAAPALADVLYGMISKVDVEAKKFIVAQEETHKEFEIALTKKTMFVTKKKVMKADIEKLSQYLKKAQDKGLPGLPAKVEHTGGMASKITFGSTKN